MKLEYNVDHNAYYDNMRYKLTMRICIMLVITLSFLGLSFAFLNKPVFYFDIIGLAIISILILILKRTKKYKLPALIFALSGTVMTICTLLLLPNALHIVDPLWMLIISLFTYFTLNKLAGNITIILQFSAITYFIFFHLNDNLKLVRNLSQGEFLSLAINVAICGVIIAYLIHHFLKRNEFAHEQYRKLTTELQQKNNLVETQNKEKTAMLMEIHHRVKNNLQVITSLLRLQSRELENEEALASFNEAIDRVSAMALIHNQMYQSKDLNNIELEPYIRDLTDKIIASYILEIPVELDFKIELTYTPSDIIVPIALLCNELISNSIKHAFVNKAKGKISIGISGDLNDQIKFKYADNGTWIVTEKTDSFGLELIETLADQLNGTVVRDITNGTVYDFILSPKKY